MDRNGLRRMFARLGVVAMVVVAPSAGASQPGIRLLDASLSSTAGPEEGRISVGLHADAYATAWKSDQIVLRQFPLPDGSHVDLELESFSIIGPQTRWITVSADGEDEFEPTAMRHYRGRVIGYEGSMAYLWLRGGQTGGLIELPGIVGLDQEAGGGQRFQFGPDHIGRAASGHFITLWRGADGPLCEVDAMVASVSEQVDRQPSTAGIVSTTLLLATIAVDATQQYHDQFGSVAAATTYLESLMAAVSVIFERDLLCQLQLGNVRVFTVTGPYSGTDVDTLLSQLETEWTTNPVVMNLPRTVTHLLTIQQGEGGVAYVDVLCDNTFGYGVSAVDGTYTYPTGSYTWDVNVIAHELGHNFGSEHTHCYTPVLDMCYNQESGCYGGTVIPTVGTMMSYCHLVASVDLQFHSTVQGVIRPRIEAAACVPPVTDGAWLYWRSLSDGSNVLWKVDGTTIVESHYITSLTDQNWQIGGTGDFDGDGDQDIVWRDGSVGSNAVWFMSYDGTPTVLSGVFLPSVSDYTIVAVADLDNDGNDDLIWRHDELDLTAVWYMNGTTIVSSAWLQQGVGDTPWELVAAGDLNGDGKTDLIWRHPDLGLNAVWLMDNTEVLAGVYITTVGAGWSIRGVADMNEDGHLDLLWRQQGSGTNVIWYMNGLEISSTAYLTTVGSNWHLAGPR